MPMICISCCRSLKQGWHSLGQQLDRLAEHHREKVVWVGGRGGRRYRAVDTARCTHVVLSCYRLRIIWMKWENLCSNFFLNWRKRGEEWVGSVGEGQGWKCHTDSRRQDMWCALSLVTWYLSPSHYLSYVRKQPVVTCLSHQLWCCCLSLSAPFNCLVEVMCAHNS